jgi:tRNA(fMet)-specific endonuclease VapC
MPQFVFDTDHLTLLEHGHPPLLARMSQFPPLSVAISAITAEEALRGRLAYLARPLVGAARVRGYALLVGTIQLINQLPLLPFDDASEHRYQHLRSLRLGIGTQDLRIAAVTLVNQLTLLTRNGRDFNQVPGLMLDDWSP